MSSHYLGVLPASTQLLLLHLALFFFLSPRWGVGVGEGREAYRWSLHQDEIPKHPVCLWSVGLQKGAENWVWQYLMRTPPKLQHESTRPSTGCTRESAVRIA